MNDHTIALVRESFDLIEPIAPQAGAMFYANLSESEPSLRPSSGFDAAARGAELMQLVALAVSRLDEPALLIPELQALGQRRAAQHLRPEHCDSARAALLKTLYQCLGVAYNPEVEAAWLEAYALVTHRLKEAAGMPA